MRRRSYSCADVVTARLEHGFRLVRQHGSRLQLRESGSPVRTEIVPMGRTVMRRGMLLSVLRLADLTDEALQPRRHNRGV